MKNTILVYIFCAFVLQTYAQKRFSYSYDAAGNMTLRQEICLTCRKEKLDSTQSVKDSIMGYSYSVFPNPVQEYLRLEVAKYDTNHTYKWTLININGVEIANGEQEINMQKTIEFASLPVGQYILTLFVNNRRKEYKIIKQ